MVSPSKFLKSPVVSLFSSSPALSRAAQDILTDLFSLEPLSLHYSQEDELDQVLNIPIFSPRWDSVASKCPSSGAILHFLALTSDSSDNVRDHASSTKGNISLLGVTDSDCILQNDASAVNESRRLLATHIMNGGRWRSAIKSCRLAFNHAAGRPVQASDITNFRGGLPLLYLPGAHERREGIRSKQTLERSGIKELVVPFLDDGLYPNGQSLLSLLGSSTLGRPVVGLYQWPNSGIALRPLPSAREDLSLANPSIVFYCDNIDRAAKHVSSLGASFAKIGYNGLDKHGQLMISHSSLLGLDIRLTDSSEFASAFPEAQDSMLASSHDELQSARVIVEDGEGGASARKNNGDCWMEFRASMKRPSGFLKKRSCGNRE